MSDPKLPAQRIRSAAATRASSDDQLLASWLDSLGSPHSRRNFETTARRFLDALAVQGLALRTATVEDVRDALATITSTVADTTARQYVLRVKSLIGYAHKLGFTPFNAGVAITVKGERSSLATRIISETEIALLIRAARSKRDRLMLGVGYMGGLRVSELTGMRWADVITRGDGRVQLSITGKGGKVRQVVLPERIGADLLKSRGEATNNDPVFQSRKGGALDTVTVTRMVKATARRAGVNPDATAHWLRHAHASHALDRGATVAEVQATLGHASISTTSAYLHARPGSSSGMALDQGVWLR